MRPLRQHPPPAPRPGPPREQPQHVPRDLVQPAARGHVRVDIFYDNFEKRKRIRTDILGLAWLFLPWAILVGWSRHLLRVHSTIDITCGGLIGVALGVLASWFILGWLKRQPT